MSDAVDTGRKLNFGVVGAGLLGEVHIRSLLQHPLAEVTAICDTDSARLQRVSERYEIPAKYTDQRLMHEKESLDGVVIATSDEHHRIPTILAAEAGKHILLEKPLATTLEDADAMLNAVAKANVKLMLGFTLRWIGTYTHIRDRAVAGEFGPLTTAYARRSVRFAEARRINGRCTPNDYLAVHDLDMMLWTLGREVESIYTTAGRFVLQRELGVPDFYWNVLKFKSGATAVLHANWSQQDAYANDLDAEFIVYGEKGSGSLAYSGSQLRVVNEDGFKMPETTLGGAYVAEIEHFVDCIRYDRTPLAGGQDGLDALKIILAATESEKTGLPIPIQL